MTSSPLLSVIVPVYNEAATVGEVLRRVLAEETEKEVVVVDDASTDATAAILAAVRDPRVRVLRHDRNRGKGAAVRTGVEVIRGRFAVIQDADLELFPEDYPSLLAPLCDGRADAVFGRRVAEPGARWPLRLRAANAILSAAAGWAAGRTFSDVMTCYKAMPADHWRAVAPRRDGFEMEVEMALALAARGARIAEVPVRYRPRSVGAGKKIRWHDFFRVLGETLRGR